MREFVFNMSNRNVVRFGTILWLLSIAFGYSYAQETLSLKSMSYNIRIASPPSKGWGTTELDSIVAVINRHAPHLIALQEVDVHTSRSGQGVDQAKELAKLIGMHYFFAKAVDRSDGDYGVAVLSKLPIVSAKAYRILSPDSVKNEHRAMAVIEVEWQNRPLVFASFHLDHLDNSVREYQIKQIFKNLEKYQDRPILIGADLNVHSDSPFITLIERAGLKMLKKNKDHLTFPNDEPKVTLDYFLFNKLFQSSHSVLQFETLYLENYASDHLPITLTFEGK